MRSYFVVEMAEAYVCKVTSVGQITLPKEVREELNVGGEDFIILEKVGKTYFIKKAWEEKSLLKKIRAKVKKSGITKERLTEILEETSRGTWRQMYESVRSCQYCREWIALRR
jgi:AbrB family looped-hinge helix DNA binding protein